MFELLVIAWADAAAVQQSVQQAPAPAPPLDLIEFLGEWGGDDGNVIDPTSLDNNNAPDSDPNTAAPTDTPDASSTR